MGRAVLSTENFPYPSRAWAEPVGDHVSSQLILSRSGHSARLPGGGTSEIPGHCRSAVRVARGRLEGLFFGLTRGTWLMPWGPARSALDSGGHQAAKPSDAEDPDRGPVDEHAVPRRVEQEGGVVPSVDTEFGDLPVQQLLEPGV